jgi:glycosyltransferase involved in cell wall biosynthesis
MNNILGIIQYFYNWLFYLVKYVLNYFIYINNDEIIQNNNENIELDLVINTREKNESEKDQEFDDDKINIGLLTNEIPPIIYGGVSTWIVNFIKMFENSEKYRIIPIFLAYADDVTDDIMKKYKYMRVIKYKRDIKTVFKDIKVCINNLWIALDTIKEINSLYPELIMVSVCHSLIKMEHLTNLGSQYTSNFYEQEITFKNSDFVVLISKAEKKYYEEFGYNKYKAIPVVIYNSYKPKFDNLQINYDYKNNNIGYIGRHVPRKRPELPIRAVIKAGRSDILVFNMGVDYSKGGNSYWMKLEKEFKEQLTIIPFSPDKKKIKKYWERVGANCITGIYEPFGYTMCETLDRCIPAIVQNIDGPSEIVEEIKDHVYMYKVNKKDIDKDIDNLSEALQKFWKTSPEERKDKSEKAREALDKFRPEVIGKKWSNLLDECLSEEFKKNRKLSDDTTDYWSSIKSLLSYGYNIHLRKFLDSVLKEKKN